MHGDSSPDGRDGHFRGRLIVLYVVMNSISPATSSLTRWTRSHDDCLLLRLTDSPASGTTQATHEECPQLFHPGVAPLTGGLILWYILGWTFCITGIRESYTHFELFHREIGGTFTLDVGASLSVSS